MSACRHSGKLFSTCVAHTTHTAETIRGIRVKQVSTVADGPERRAAHAHRDAAHGGDILAKVVGRTSAVASVFKLLSLTDDSVSNKCIAVRKVATPPLRELTCHVG